MIEVEVKRKEGFGGGYVKIRYIGRFSAGKVLMLLRKLQQEDPKKHIEVIRDGVTMHICIGELEL
jgi:hypothetical protein